MNQERSKPRPVIIKVAKFKDGRRILKASREEKKKSHMQKNPIRLLADFFSRNFTGQREQHDIH